MDTPNHHTRSLAQPPAEALDRSAYWASIVYCDDCDCRIAEPYNVGALRLCASCYLDHLAGAFDATIEDA